MIPTEIFTKTIDSNKAEKTGQTSTSTRIQQSNRIDSRDIVRARIESLLDFAYRKSSSTSLPNLQNN